MPEIIEVFTVQRRLFAPEALPWTYLATESSRQRLQERYRFGGVNLFPDPTQNSQQIVATLGEFKQENGAHPIQQLLLGPNFVEFQITGPSDVADALFDNLALFIAEVNPARSLVRDAEYAKTYQTVAIAKLNFPREALIPESLREVLRSIPTRLTREDAEVKIQLQNLAWKVMYQPKETTVQYLARELRIEPREGSRPEDNLYYTQSPSDYKTHLEILEAVEKTLSSRSS